MMHHSDIKKFVIYCSQMVSPFDARTVEALISEENYEIEQRDMLISSESAEDLLAYRKADLIFYRTYPQSLCGLHPLHHGADSLNL